MSREAGRIFMTDYSDLIKKHFGSAAKLSVVRPVSGGDINAAYLIILSDGRRVFLKENTGANAAFFRAEREGLTAIKKTEAIRVPEVLDAGILEDRAYLMMEYLEAAPAKPDLWERFGRQLARMHMADASGWTPGGRFGFPGDNFIGAGAQKNDVRERWIDFFRECRLEVQFKRAEQYFDAAGRKRVLRLLERLDGYLTEPEQPSLLHGDLWGGNFVTGPDGYAWLIDPAVYVGHDEADLAMTELFGGFSPVFYDSYREVNALMPGYAERRDLYNLYHLLNHLNLFGPGYLGSVMRIVQRFS